MPENARNLLTIPLEQIRPDPNQPRRLLPGDLAERLVQGGKPSDILEELRARAQRNRWLREKLAELDGLADSIAVDGLMQPIRVYREGEDHYKIEEGERRWWAHHVLVGRGQNEFDRISVILVATSDADKNLLRRRVAENIHRSVLTAIELARAMSQRVAEMREHEPRMKRREAERLVGRENQMTDRRVRQYLALLSLTPQVLEFAQQTCLTENALRNLLGIKDSWRQLERARRLANPSKPMHRASARADKSKRKAARSRGQMKQRRCITNVSMLPAAPKVHNDCAQTHPERKSQRIEITKSLDAVIAAGRALKGVHLTEAERRYWHERLDDNLVAQSLAELVILLNDSEPSVIQNQGTRSGNVKETE